MLEPKLLELLLVGGEAQAPRSRERVAGKQLEAVEVRLRQPPVRASCIAPERLARDVVAHRSTPEREAAVPAAGATRDRTRFVEANVEPALGQCKRARAAGDAAADHLDVGNPIERSPRERLRRGLRPPPRDRL